MDSRTGSKAKERAVDALLEDERVPDDVRRALTDDERAEVAGLAATARLTRSVLQAPEVPPHAEASSLRRAQAAVTARPPSAPDTAAARPRTGFLAWLARWRKGR